MGDRPTDWFIELLKNGIEKIKASTAIIGSADVETANIGEATIKKLDLTGPDQSNGFLTPGDMSSDLNATFGDTVGVSDSTAVVMIEAEAVTDGVDKATVSVDVDEKGTGTVDYNITAAEAQSSLEAGESESRSTPFVTPPGTQITVLSESDPDGSNAIVHSRVLEL